MIRAVVKYTFDGNGSTEENSFILNVSDIDVNAKAEIVSMKCFEREIDNFKYDIPEVNRLLAKIGDHNIYISANQ